MVSECSGHNNECYNTDMRAILNAGHQIQTVLYNQDERFLKTVPRTCSPPPDVRSNHVNQAWNVQQGNFKVFQNVQVIKITLKHFFLKGSEFTNMLILLRR